MTTAPDPTAVPEGVHRRIYALLRERGAVSAFDLMYATGQAAATRRLREVREALSAQGWTISCQMDEDGVRRYRLEALPGALKQETMDWNHA